MNGYDDWKLATPAHYEDPTREEMVEYLGEDSQDLDDGELLEAYNDQVINDRNHG